MFKDLRIVLVGKTGAGKSASGNTILNKDEFIVMKSLDSVTTSCKKENVNIDGRLISVIDTPGLFDTSMTEEKLKAEIERCVEMSAPGPHVFLLVIRLDVRFTDEEKNTVKWIQENFGEDSVKYTIILFTHAEYLGNEPVDKYIKKCNNIKLLLGQCDDRYHTFDNMREGSDQVIKLLNMIEEMVKNNGGDHYTNEMYKKAQEKIQWEKGRKKAKVLTMFVGTVAVVGMVVGAGTAGAGGVLAVAAARLGGTAAARVGAAVAAVGAAGLAGVVGVVGTIMRGRAAAAERVIRSEARTSESGSVAAAVKRGDTEAENAVQKRSEGATVAEVALVVAVAGAVVVAEVVGAGAGLAAVAAAAAGAIAIARH